MTTTFPAFPDVDPLAVDVLGARPGRDPGTEVEAVEIAFQEPGEDPQVLSLSIQAAYELREAIDEALEAPFWWEGVSDDDREVLAVALKAHGAMRAAGVVDLARDRSVRWDEDWASSPFR
jgi:hypothetical protein